MTKTEPQEVAPVFGIVRRKSRSELVRQELNQGMEHFRQAAAHAAQGTGATVGPKFYAARDRMQPAAGRVKDVAVSGWGSTVASLAPLAAAATENARQTGKDAKQANQNAKKAAKAKDKANTKAAKKLQKKATKAVGGKQSKGKSSKLTGLLLVGAAVGAGAAYLAKRRQGQQWEEYDPSRPIAVAEPTDPTVVEPSSTSVTESFTTTETTPVRGDATALTTPVGDDDLDIATTPVDQTSSALHNPEVARLAGGGTAPNKL
ncbi:MAG TPA: hypothetical protein VF657_06790 [Actinoplanes sp.]|jgi:hypothetical protein